MEQTIILKVKDIIYENGKNEVCILTPKAWAGRMRRKGYKKTIITKKEIASIHIKIKTK